MHLDTVCTMVDVDAIVMYPNVADTLSAYAVTCPEPTGDENQIELLVAPAEPFLVAAAKAMGIDTLRQIDTGLDPVTTGTTPWPWRRGSRSPTSATSRPTSGSATRAST